jgi:hypothetical protein
MKRINKNITKSATMIALFLFVSNVNAGALDKIVNDSKSSSPRKRSLTSLNETPLGSHSFGVGLGQTFLTGDFGENGEDSITVDLYYKYKASYSFDLMVNGHYSSHSLAEKQSELFGLNAGIKAKLYNFDAFNPYLLGGLGFYLPSVKRVVSGSLKSSESKLSFGTHIGLGGELELNDKFSVGVLAHYHNPFDVKQGNDPEVEGSYYKLLFTTLYSF